MASDVAGYRLNQAFQKRVGQNGSPLVVRRRRKTDTWNSRFCFVKVGDSVLGALYLEFLRENKLDE